MPSNGLIHVRWQSDWVQEPATYSGVTVGSYEYRRYETGASPWWVPLRFPGWGPESDRRPDDPVQEAAWPSIAKRLGDPRPYSGEEWAAFRFAATVGAEIDASLTLPSLPYRPVDPSEYGP